MNDAVNKAIINFGSVKSMFTIFLHTLLIQGNLIHLIIW